MQWVDEAIVLGVKRHGEGSAILEAMTREHGRHLGLVRGAASTRLRPVLQPGNRVGLTWRARLDEHLGNYAVEGLDLAAARLLDAGPALYGLTHAAALCRLLPERDPHPEIHVMLDQLVDALIDVRIAAALMARFELALLAELGFGLDLDSCAATGATAELIYVSPKSGRAVSREAGLPWADKLLRLPAFLRAEEETPALSAADLADAFAVTGYFLSRHVLEPRGLSMPDARASFVAAAVNVLAPAPAA
jgi:DNA repair protein RecO (recombination protein O)